MTNEFKEQHLQAHEVLPIVQKIKINKVNFKI